MNKVIIILYILHQPVTTKNTPRLPYKPFLPLSWSPGTIILTSTPDNAAILKETNNSLSNIKYGVTTKHVFWKT